MRYELLNTTVITAGVWVSVNDLGGIIDTLDINGDFAAAAFILEGSNEEDPNVTPPSNPYEILNQSAAGSFQLSGRFEWYRARNPSIGSGTMKVNATIKGIYNERQ